MNPLELVFSWQALLHVLAIIALTSAAKAGIDYALGKRQAEEPGYRAARFTGMDMRRTHPAVGQVLLPLLPWFLGILLAELVPLRPEVLDLFAASKRYPSVLLFAGWGILNGVLAEYWFDRVQLARRAFRGRAG